MLNSVDPSRGCVPGARLASVAPERIIAYAFLDVAYLPPNPEFDIFPAYSQMKASYGYEPFGYQIFMASDEAADILKNNVCSLPLYKKHLC